MAISDEWAQWLLQEPFTSSGKYGTSFISNFYPIATGRTQRSLLIETNSRQGRNVQRAHPRFTITTDVANFANVDQIGNGAQPVPDVFADQHQGPQLFSQERAAAIAMEIAAEQVDNSERESRHEQSAAPSRNRNGALRDPGDRRLENEDEEHPGLADDQITSRSMQAS